VRANIVQLLLYVTHFAAAAKTLKLISAAIEIRGYCALAVTANGVRCGPSIGNRFLRPPVGSEVLFCEHI
jgi:hypothetical protein